MPLILFKNLLKENEAIHKSFMSESVGFLPSVDWFL